VRPYGESLETYLSIPVAGILMNPAALENPDFPAPTDAILHFIES